MGYQYRGKIHDVTPEPGRTASTPGPKPQPFNPDHCGTYRGFKQHYRHATAPCEPCKAANREYRRGFRKPRQLKPCGTHAAYRRHIKDGTEPCQPCNEANNAYNREHARTHLVSVDSFSDSACGTYRGYRRHKRRGLTPCEPCNKANATYQANYRERRAA